MNNVLHKPDGSVSPVKNKATLGMMLVTIGIVYGDIGTSPMYVMKSILEGTGFSTLHPFLSNIYSTPFITAFQ